MGKAAAQWACGEAMNSIVEAVRTHAGRQPERPAILFEGRTRSYGNLAADMERWARALAGWGLRPGDRVALFLENRPEFAVTYLGAQLAGGIVVLVNTQYRQVELSHILTDAGVRLCVTDAAGEAELRRLALPDLAAVILVGMEGAATAGTPARYERMPYADFIGRGGESAASLPLPTPDQPALIGYTSGTTGRAKGALLLHSNLLANITALTTAWRWSSADRLLLTLPLFHAHGLMVGLHGTLYTGGSAVLRRKFDAADVLAAFRHDPRITLFFGVPTMYARLLAEAERSGVPSHLPRLFVSGSAPLSAQIFAEFERLFGQRILERYGMTETIMNLTNPHDGERRPGTVGGPFPGQEARGHDRDDHEPDQSPRRRAAPWHGWRPVPRPGGARGGRA
jgi:malonyl-CoA/methylmalonyl-CoA synthetase